MGLERRFKIWIFGLLGINIFVGFAAIALFERILPNIAQMVSYHDVLIEDLEKMLFSLAKLNTEADPEVYTQFQQTLAQTKLHLQRSEQLAIVEQIERMTEAPPPWSKKRLEGIINNLSRLSATLRKDLYEAYKETKFHSLTSGWVIVFITTISMLIVGWSAKRVNKQIIEPVSEMCRGLVEWRRGNKLRRFKTIEGGDDVKEAMAILNEILDHRG